MSWCTAIRFDAKLVSAPLTQTAATLKQFLRTAPQSVFLKYMNEDSWAARLRRRLRDNIGAPDWPGLEDIAQELHVASTTLRRRLIAEGTSFQEIKDELRRDAVASVVANNKTLGFVPLTTVLAK